MRTQPVLVFQNALPALPPVERNTPALSNRHQHQYSDRITGSIFLPGQEGRYAELPSDLPAALASALRTRDIDRHYSHQAEAWHAVQAGAHVVIVTPSASGKSFCYTLPLVAGAVISAVISSD